MSNEILQIITSLINLIKDIAWPISAVIIAFLFRSEIIKLIPRIQEAGLTKLTFTPMTTEQQQKSVDKKIDEKKQLRELPGMSRTPAIERIEVLIHSQLSSIEDDKKVDFLVRLLAQARLETFFEYTYSLIFGSQISGLKRLNQTGFVHISDARVFFSDYEKIYHDFYKGYGFDGWINFLIIQELVNVKGDIVSITDLGKDFLVFITAKGRPEDKPW